MSKKEIGRLIADVRRKPGWRVEDLPSGHVRVYPPPPGEIVHIGLNGTDFRTIHNVKAQLKRAGFYDPAPDEDAKDCPMPRAIAREEDDMPQPPPTTTETNESPKRMLNLILLGRKLAKLPSDTAVLGVVCSVMEDAEKLGLSISDVRELFEAVALEHS